MAKFWTPQLKLDPSLPWRLESRPLKVYGRETMRYCAVLGDQEYYLDRVTGILDRAFGKSEALIGWAANQVLLDVLTRFVPGNGDKDSHLHYWDRIQETIEKLLTEKGTTDSKGKVTRGKSWTFPEVATRLSYHLPPPEVPEHFGWAWLGEILQSATQARYRSLQKAGELGTRAHELIEIWIKGDGELVFEEGGNRYKIDLADEPPEVQSAVRAFWSFWDQHEFKIHSTEVKLMDVANGVAGTADCFVRPANDPSELILLDWKTSKGIYADKFLQVTAYGRMAEKCGLGWPSKAYLVRFDKHTAQFEIVPVWNDRLEFLAFGKLWGFAMAMARWLDATDDYLKKLKAAA